MPFTNLNYHIVFSTKERRPFLKDDLLSRTCEYLTGIVRNIGGAMIRANGMPDHIHIAAQVPARLALSDSIAKIKANSSKWLHETVGMDLFRWQDGYAAFTVSSSVVAKLVSYIKNQQQHHTGSDFIQELKVLLDAHGIQYKEEYLL